MTEVRLFAAAAAAAGTTSVVTRASSLSQLRDELSTQHPDLTLVLASCSFLVDGVAAHGDDLGAASTVDVLPPFAGG